ncbi:hypothetical protein SPRG_00276 [Saprolegnia parasitica CBS 223.65]|uniref:BAR domain-containing protein n=1 Tax=Saprolegnia parasitica (strain CBS 223.65) TaxID=695850 RepID=A0A067CY39_SAPPC|nr:hypothetical protein SPRG_00276 [Saprolegnia parasitica CBS 223.65]KDO35428.1 hypothetical protein SPRG_00276 [Saprolegnia parasitica CBS 223.65]|eukprot:XP_012193768.1 hypothetical protein SPRG_00276 [Saprolegnia parasitica CBS 223.65]
MSSIRVRATNKLMAKLGATKPSKNTQFDMAHAGFEELQSGVVNLDNALQGFILSLKGFHASANVLLRAVEDVASVRGSDNAGAAPEVRQFIEVFKACSLSIDISKLNELVKTFETRVQKPSQGWLHQVAHLKTEIEDFNESHITFDHYTKKVQTLRDAHNKRAGAGKQEKSKDVDKLHRNEQKLVSISTNYNKTSEKTVQDLRTFLHNRDATLLPLVQRIIEFRLAHAKDMYDLTAKMEPLLHISSFNEHLARLESFAPSGHDSAIPPATRADDEPDVTVTTLSFSDFVGPTSASPAPASPTAPTADFSRRQRRNPAASTRLQCRREARGKTLTRRRHRRRSRRRLHRRPGNTLRRAPSPGVARASTRRRPRRAPVASRPTAGFQPSTHRKKRRSTRLRQHHRRRSVMRHR